MASNLIPGPRRIKRRGNVEYLPTIEWREVALPSWATELDQFLLVEICGESLCTKGIHDGDFVLVHLTDSVLPGDLVAVSTPAGFLVKFLSYEENGAVCLSGDGHIPRIFPANSVHIEGRIIR